MAEYLLQAAHSHATELTTLKNNGIKNGHNSYLSINNNYNNSSIKLFRKFWHKISDYVWKLIIFLIILMVINVIFRSLSAQQTNLIFNSNKSDESNVNTKNINYAISNDQIEPNIVWISSEEELDSNSEYLNKFIIKQGILFEEEIDFDAVTIDNDEYEEIEAIEDLNNYMLKTTQFSIHIYINAKLTESIQQIINELNYDNEVWQNSLIVITAKSNALVYGPQIANKQRGTKSHEVSLFSELLVNKLVTF